MKKIITFVLCVLIVCSSFGISANAEIKVDDKAEIIEKSLKVEKNSKKSDLELGKEKLKEAGYTTDFIDEMPESMLLKAKDAISVHRTIRYYSSDGSDLVQIDKAKFDEKRNTKNEKKELAEKLDLIDLTSYDEVSMEKSNVSTRATETFDNGTIAVSMDIYTVSGGEQGQFWAVCTYDWSDMPDSNYTDYVGISRDEKSSVLPNSAGGFWVYKYTKYSLYAGPSGVSVMNSSNYTEDDNVSFSELEINEGAAYIMSVPMPPDYWPGSMVQGTFATGYLPTDGYGAVEYDGIPAYPNQTSNINHWGTYSHQYKALNFWQNISFSYPLGVSFTVNPESEFKKVVDESLWTYRP